MVCQQYSSLRPRPFLGRLSQLCACSLAVSILPLRPQAVSKPHQCTVFQHRVVRASTISVMLGSYLVARATPHESKTALSIAGAGYDARKA